MTIMTPMNDFLTVAEKQVSDLFSHAGNAQAFLTHCQAFDKFISDSSHYFTAPNPLPYNELKRLTALQRKLAMIELVAKTNAGLVTDMPDYVDQSVSGLR